MSMASTGKGSDEAHDYDRLWSEISGCETCKFDGRIDEKIREHWQAVETPFLPFPGVGPEPSGALPVRYLLVGMEPSLRPRRTKTREYMRKKIADGSRRNFRGDVHIRWAAQQWLVKRGREAFVMTDLAKCMMPTKGAYDTAPRRYANCARWLGREIDLFKDTLRAIVPLGGEPHRWLVALAQPAWPPITRPIVHPGHRFTKKFKKDGTDYTGLPSDEEFASFAERCDRKAKKKLDKRRRALLARWQVQFAEIRSELAPQWETDPDARRNVRRNPTVNQRV